MVPNIEERSLSTTSDKALEAVAIGVSIPSVSEREIPQILVSLFFRQMIEEFVKTMQQIQFGYHKINREMYT